MPSTPGLSQITAVTFRTEDVVKAFRGTRKRGSPGPDNISSQVLKHCAGQLDRTPDCSGLYFNTLSTVTLCCTVFPPLFILYTDDCRSTQPDCNLVKYADNTVFLSLLSGSSHQHRPVLQEFVEWCDNSKLELNVSKTKEMMVTFSSRQRDMMAAAITIIHGKLGGIQISGDH